MNKTIYIKEYSNDLELLKQKEKKYPELLKKLVIIYRKCFKVLVEQEYKYGNIIVIPVNKEKSINKNIEEKIKKIVVNQNIKNIVLSNYLEEYSKLKTTIKNVNFLDGRELFKNLSLNVVDYICKMQKVDMKTQEVVLLVNKDSTENIRIIEQIARSVKSVKIVTNNIKNFSRLEEYLYQNFGIMISITQNKRKSLKNAKIILNIDFSEDEINKCEINRNSIIVNFEKKIKLNSKFFNGININYYCLKEDEEIMDVFDKWNLYKSFKIEILLESLMYNKEFELINNRIKLKELVGNNGNILKEEYGRILQKIA